MTHRSNKDQGEKQHWRIEDPAQNLHADQNPCGDPQPTLESAEPQAADESLAERAPTDALHNEPVPTEKHSTETSIVQPPHHAETAGPVQHAAPPHVNRRAVPAVARRIVGIAPSGYQPYSAPAGRSESLDHNKPGSGIKLPAGRQPIDDLVDRIKRSADQLARDGSSRGDLKLLSRTLRELRYAFKVFSPYRRRRKVTIFGSARTNAGEPAYQQTVDFARTMANHGWLIVTGAASGIMEAGHVGAGRSLSMGLNILLPFEQAANPVIAGDEKLVNMKYFFTRKVMFVKECDAVVCLPGGFGTLDEATEVLTLLQTGKRDIVPLILLDAEGGDYWHGFQDFVVGRLLRRRMISSEDLWLYSITDSCDEAVQEILNFYRVYHSMRYVRDGLVLRLQQPPSDELLEQIHDRFGSMATDGRFVVSPPLPEEVNEPELTDLARLFFRFDRRSLGQLRMLINCLNAESTKPADDGARKIASLSREE